MAIFWNVFLKTIAFFLSIVSIIVLITLLISFVEDRNDKFTFFFGNENSSNLIAVIELNGLIIEKNRQFPDLTNTFIISPSEIKNNLDILKQISPKLIIFSINSPGGTVSASKNFYDIIKNYKKNNNIEILFHTNELLASGGYWAATSADGIYASYGSIIGSIGVKGPDWFFYDHPITISTGIFGNTVETKNGIKIFSSKAGKSKDIFNPFRKPTKDELNHFQNMVDEIYYDFVRIVSKERKIETNTIINDIGALIYTSDKASDLHLINDELSINDLVTKKVREKGFKDYKVIKMINPKNSLLKELITGNFYNSNTDIKFECLSLRSSIAAILSYEAIGC